MAGGRAERAERAGGRAGAQEPLVPAEVTSRALLDPDDIDVNDFARTPVGAMTALACIVKLLQSVRQARACTCCDRLPLTGCAPS